MVGRGEDGEENAEIWGGGLDGAVPEESSKSQGFVSPGNRVIAVVAAIALIISLTAFAGIGPAAPLVDSDADGIFNWSDNCPNVANSNQLNYDGDANGDVCDDDDDNDLVSDIEDDFPLDPLESVDSDNDGIGDKADTDDDGDGTNDGQDAFPLDSSEDTDTDGDGVGDNADTDDDGDGTHDDWDAFPLDSSEDTDYDGDGVGDNSDSDDDNDGVMDYIDSCPRSFIGHSLNDYDYDGCYDNEDDDEDDDGLDDWLDDCRQGWRSWTRDGTSDHDGDGCHDSVEDDDDDNDGYLDYEDACPKGLIFAIGDFDQDGCYNTEDDDRDNDGILTSDDWYGYGNGHITIGVTYWSADVNDCDYDSSCGNPDVYFMIQIDADCDSSNGYEIMYNQFDQEGYYSDVREISTGFVSNNDGGITAVNESYYLASVTFDLPETASEFCFVIYAMDYDSGWLEDNEYLLYTQEGWLAYYHRINDSFLPPQNWLGTYLDRSYSYSTIGVGEDMQSSITYHVVAHDENGNRYMSSDW
ncbi:MAG: thrombospondin type 3 repeat-containing protein [Candidatus Thermoplasmatota archaeon]|nr:thrombospondin type 3 repeat-containing protein [Candidatus Thermoplasmatota archaeon]